MKIKDLIEILEHRDPEMEVIVPYREFHEGECIDISWTEKLAFEEMNSQDVASVSRNGEFIFQNEPMLVIVPEEYDLREPVEDPPE